VPLQTLASCQQAYSDSTQASSFARPSLCLSSLRSLSSPRYRGRHIPISCQGGSNPFHQGGTLATELSCVHVSRNPQWSSPQSMGLLPLSELNAWYTKAIGIEWLTSFCPRVICLRKKMLIVSILGRYASHSYARKLYTSFFEETFSISSWMLT